MIIVLGMVIFDLRERAFITLNIIISYEILVLYSYPARILVWLLAKN